MKAFVITIIIILTAAIWLFMGPLVVYSPAFKIVVHNENGMPISDAIVVAAWQTKSYHGHDGYLVVKEGFTSIDGVFEVDSWFRFKLPWRLNVEVDAPIVGVFKPERVMNDVSHFTEQGSPNLFWQSIVYSSGVPPIVMISPEAVEKRFPKFRTILRNGLYPERNCWRDIIPMALDFLEANKNLLTSDQLKILDKNNC